MTTDDTTTGLSGDDAVTAAEYVMRLLPDDEHRAFEARLDQSRVLQAEVARWAEHFATLSEDIAPVAPPPQVLRRLNATLFAESRKSLWQQIRPYFLGGAVAAGVAWMAADFGWLATGPVAPELTATLASDSVPLTLLASYADGALSVRRDGDGAAAGRDHELWVIIGDAAPVSLGVLDADGETVIPVSADLVPALSGALLAVSDEIAGGSPTGAPQGPVLAAGPLTLS